MANDLGKCRFYGVFENMEHFVLAENSFGLVFAMSKCGKTRNKRVSRDTGRSEGEEGKVRKSQMWNLIYPVIYVNEHEIGNRLRTN